MTCLTPGRVRDPWGGWPPLEAMGIMHCISRLCNAQFCDSHEKNMWIDRGAAKLDRFLRKSAMTRSVGLLQNTRATPLCCIAPSPFHPATRTRSLVPPDVPPLLLRVSFMPCAPSGDGDGCAPPGDGDGKAAPVSGDRSSLIGDREGRRRGGASTRLRLSSRPGRPAGHARIVTPSGPPGSAERCGRRGCRRARGHDRTAGGRRIGSSAKSGARCGVGRMRCRI